MSYRALKASIIWKLLRAQKRWVWTMMGLTMLSSLVGFGATKRTRDFIDEGIIDQSETLPTLFAALVTFVIARSITGLVARQVAARVGYQIEYDLRTWLYARLIQADPQRLDEVSSGQVITRAMADLRVLERIVLSLPRLVSSVPVLAGLLLFLFVSSPVLAVLALAPIPINAFIVKRIAARLRALAWVELNQKAEVTAAIDEAVRGIRLVKVFGREDHERRRVAETAARAYEYAMTRVRLVARFDLLLKPAPLLVRIALVVVGARMVVWGQVTAGEFFIFVLVSLLFTALAQSLDEIVALWQFARTGGNRVMGLMAHAGAAPAEAVGAADLAPPSTGLQIRGAAVAFGGRAVASDVEVSVAYGQTVCIRGGPGSGKTTVARLAVGFQNPHRGSVRLDGVDLRGIRVAARRALRLVGEDPFLFSRTVRENLMLGNGDATDAQLRAAVRAAGADAVVEDLPEGLDTVLGDRGLTLSGGQRQRLALARALLTAPRVLVLDDALSAVEPSFEVEILQRVRAHAPDAAILVISGRDGPERLADHVVRLPDHRSVAAGFRQPAWAVTAAMPGAAAGMRYDPETAVLGAAGPDGLTPAVAAQVKRLQFSGDVPEIGEAAATESDEAPSVRNVLRPLALRLVQASAALVVFTATGLIPEFAFGRVIDSLQLTDAVLPADVGRIDRIGLLLLGLAIPTALAAYWFRLFSGRIDQGISYLLRRRLFQRLSRMGIDYYDRELPGYVATRVVHDLDVVSRFVDTGLYRLVVNTALFFFASGAMLILSPQMFSLIAGFAVTIVVLTLAQVPVADRAFARVRARTGVVVADLQEDFAGRRALHDYGAQREAGRRFAMRAWELRNARRFATSVLNVYVEVVDLIAGIAGALIFLRAGNLALAGTLSVGTVLTLRLYLDQAIRPIPEMGEIWQDYLLARVSFRQLAAPYDAPIRPVLKQGAAPCGALAGEIAFDNVSFSYPDTSRQILRDVSFTVAPGAVVAIVGPTGAGKSSLAKLAGRVYDPTAGRVLVDGVDLRDLELDSYRQRVAVVPQEAFLFRGTLRSNLAYGRPDATDADIEAAMARVGADALLAELGDGLDTRIDEEGRNLTPAQRQAVALARAWVVRPDVLILDEATSALGPDAEPAVLAAVAGLGATTLLITHREPVALAAGRVIVVRDGRLCEDGPPAALAGAGGAFDSIWRVVEPVATP